MANMHEIYMDVLLVLPGEIIVSSYSQHNRFHTLIAYLKSFKSYRPSTYHVGDIEFFFSSKWPFPTPGILQEHFSSGPKNFGDWGCSNFICSAQFFALRGVRAHICCVDMSHGLKGHTHLTTK